MEERNLELIPRREGTREKVTPAIVKFQLSDIENHFKENIQYIRAQFYIADNLLQEDREEEAKNIWRSQIVFLESAFDFYMHELDKYGLQYIDKIRQGLKKEYARRNSSEPQETDLEHFLQMVEFVIAEEQKQEYIKRITSFRASLRLEAAFYDAVFEDIRKQQTILKIKNIDGYQIMNAAEVLQYEKLLWKKEIDALVINRILGMDIFNSKHVPNSFIDEIAILDIEERKDVIQECQSDIAKLLFDKNGRHTFWRFFGRLLSYANAIRLESPREIAEQMRRDNVMIPRTLGEKSVVYLIAALKEGLMDDN